ncbi:MAG: hypothetical protein R3B89_07175 [Polyangiaceae bacterium]
MASRSKPSPDAKSSKRAKRSDAKSKSAPQSGAKTESNPDRAAEAPGDVGARKSPETTARSGGPAPRARTDAMQLTRATRVAFTALLIVNLASAAAAIGLLGRMRPAIERIIERNIYSLEAVESMLVVLAAPEGATDANRRALDDALLRAERNITGDQERPLIARLRERTPVALGGDVAARQESLKALQELADVNRKDIEQADQNAKRLGTAGAWAVSFLALLALGSGFIGLRRFDRRVLAPLEELHSVLTDHSQGQRLRRCGALGQASKELHESMLSLNELLDSRAEESVRRIEVNWQEDSEAERGSLLAVLDLIPEPTWLVDGEGAILAANSQALARVADDAELARAVKALARGDETSESTPGVSERLQRTPVAGSERALLRLGETAQSS